MTVGKAGDRIIVEAEFYTVQYFDENGKRPRIGTKLADKSEAEKLANHLEAEAEKRRNGQIDTKAERYAQEARRPILQHLREFKQHLADNERSSTHVGQTTRQIEAILVDCNVERIDALTGAGVMRAIGERRANGASLRTCNSYLRAVRSFTRWLWKEKRTPDDGLAGLSQFNEETDRQHIRRELTPEELAHLLAHVERNPKPNFRLSGPVRAMAYRVALGTGFRVKELRTLTPVSFDLDGNPPTVKVAAAYSKRR